MTEDKKIAKNICTDNSLTEDSSVQETLEKDALFQESQKENSHKKSPNNEKDNSAKNTKIPTLHNLNLMNRFLFAQAADDREFLEIVLSIIFDEDISLTFPPQTEKEQRRSISSKNIRVDVYAADEYDQIYDAEVQDRDEHNLPKRTRYYNSMIDVNLLEPGEFDYNKLNNVYIIVIASFDIFGKGCYKYTVTRSCEEHPECKYKDGSTIIYLNTQGTDRTGVSDELISLLKYFENSSSEVAESSGSDRILKLQKKVENIRNNEEIGVKFMQAWEELAYARRDGREEGREEGEKLKSIDAAKKFKAAGVSIKIISESLGLSEEEVQKL